MKKIIKLTLYGLTVTINRDYIVNGISETDNKLALQESIDYAADNVAGDINRIIF